VLALNPGSEQERRSFRRSCYSWTFALAGFLDIALSCRILAGHSLTPSIGWGLVGAGGYAMAYLALSYASESLGDDPEGDAAARVHHDEDQDDEEDDEDEEKGTWWSEAGWMLLTWAIIVVSTVWLFLLFNAKSIFVVAVFASVAPDTTAAEFLTIVAISGIIQMMVMGKIVIPAAKRRRISL